MCLSLQQANIYIETSAVNWLAEKYSADDAIATKGLQSAKGNKWYLSPVTLWEILLTNNDKKREELIFFSQHLFYAYLLKSPSEIAIDYIEQHCPAVSLYKDFHNYSELGKVWTAINGDPGGTFLYDKVELANWTQQLKNISKKADKILHGIVLSTPLKKEEEKIQGLINLVYEHLPAVLKVEGAEKLQKLALLFLFYYMCVGIDLPQEPLDQYWQKNKVSDPLERLYFLINKAPCILEKGPFIEFAQMALHQIQLKASTGRGLFHDSLHCIYLPFVDAFFTNDDHFLSYKKLKQQPHHQKIYSISKDLVLTGKPVRIER